MTEIQRETSDYTRHFRMCLRPAWTGMGAAVLTILLGQLLGIVFGLNENIIKDRLKASAATVSSTVYADNAEAMTAVQEKSWKYFQRAHLHAGAMGTTALVLVGLTALLGVAEWQTLAISVALGFGGLGYSIFWILAGCWAPALGSTGAAKEALRWLAVPSSGAYVVGTLAVFALLVVHLSRPAGDSSRCS